jgi:hypothetical protein
VANTGEDKAIDLASSYFFEVFMLYGFMIWIAIYEAQKSAESSKNQKNEFKKLIEETKIQDDSI